MPHSSTTAPIHLDSPPPKIWAARYSAVVGDAIVSSRIELNEALPSEHLRWAIQTPPEWSIDPWPSDVDDLEVLAVAKFKALFDYGAQLPGNDRASLERDLHQAFPAVVGSNQGVKRCPVAAIIRAEDGKAEWEVAVPVDGSLPAGITGIDMGPNDRYKILIQNLIRADLIGHQHR